MHIFKYRTPAFSTAITMKAFWYLKARKRFLTSLFCKIGGESQLSFKRFAWMLFFCCYEIPHKDKLPFKVIFLFRCKNSTMGPIMMAFIIWVSWFHIFHFQTNKKLSVSLSHWNWVIGKLWQRGGKKKKKRVPTFNIEPWNSKSINIKKNYQKVFHSSLAHPLRSTWLIALLLFCSSSNHLEYLFL